MSRERTHPREACITCDLCTGDAFRRPWCKIRKHYVWATGWCEKYRVKGRMLVEE